MCGIAGMIHLGPALADRDVLQRMLGRIVHRGPDDHGQLIDRELAMGMRRLSIIDLADGKQPQLHEPDGS